MEGNRPDRADAGCSEDSLPSSGENSSTLEVESCVQLLPNVTGMYLNCRRHVFPQQHTIIALVATIQRAVSNAVRTS